MRIYRFRFAMNLKTILVLLLTVLVIFGYSFYRYFYHHEYSVKPISNAVSSSKHFDKEEVYVENLSMETTKIKARTTQETSIQQRDKQRKNTNEMNLLPPNTESEEKAKKEFFEKLDEFSRQQEMNVTDVTDDSADNETSLNEKRIKENDLNEFMYTNNTFKTMDMAGDNVEENGIKENGDSEITYINRLVGNVSNILKKKGNDYKETEFVLQSRERLMLNISESFNNEVYNVTSKYNSNLSETFEDLAKSNATLPQDVRSSSRTLMDSKRGSSIVTLRKQKGRRRGKTNGQNILKIGSKVKRKRHPLTKKYRRSKKKSFLSKDDIRHKSSLHKEGHSDKRQQHKSIHPNKKMLTNLKTNFKLDYKEGYVLDQTFFREAKLKPGYNIRNRKTSVLLLHPSMFTSSVWVNIGTMQALAESGYRNIAIDLPGYGRSKKSKIPYSRNEIIDYMIQLLGYLGLEKPVIVTPSKSGEYVMPLIMSHPYMIGGFVAIAPTDTGKYSRHFYENLDLPALVVLGNEDTSMLNWASLDNLEHLKIRRMFTIANATKECYVDRPSSFHKLLLDFLPSLSKQVRSSQ
ncbi:uncharacterized protein LOC116303523 [Actinia tenebrosa]|uniref:Uncharacterized protein LOC116303523 n=1 Tax=Actinia tenebrosa TaxID=6105 RepID=A0A6P8IPX7_ACTTE|nr:uncharacterized protein LOC116303523 [Actinia tenebrosa]